MSRESRPMLLPLVPLYRLALAARELEHLALHRADEVELLEDQPRVVGALRRVGGGRHELHVPADHGEGGAHVVHHAGEQTADGGEPLAALSLQAFR